MSLALVALSYVIYETQNIAETGIRQVGRACFRTSSAPERHFAARPRLAIVERRLAQRTADQEGHDSPDWVSFLVISAGIILHMVLIGWAGFIIASALLFVLIARGFGSQHPVRDLLLGAALAASAFAVFTLGLGLKLPAGPFVIA
jgi:putative tricarboxylic transport membrane protein